MRRNPAEPNPTSETSPGGGSDSLRDLFRGSAEVLVLSILAGGPRHGYSILSQLKTLGAGDFALKEGTLYPLLYRLVRKGWTESQWRVGETGKKQKVYQLTDEGRRVQQKRRREWIQFTAAVRSLLEGIDANNDE
ncbi:MAG: helix-turn-helix transcriptional regulator [Planctomycetota bacterium]